MEGPSRRRRSERIAGRSGRGEESQDPSPPTPSPPLPPRQRLAVTRKAAAAGTADQEAPDASQAGRADAPPQKPHLSKLRTPQSREQKHVVMRHLGASPLYASSPSARMPVKRRLPDGVEASPAKKARVESLQTTHTPLPFHKQTVVSPEGEVLLSPITARRSAPRRKSILAEKAGDVNAPATNSADDVRRQAAAFHLEPPGPNEKSATAPGLFRFPQSRPIVPETTKMKRIEKWLRAVEFHRLMQANELASRTAATSHPTSRMPGSAAVHPETHQDVIPDEPPVVLDGAAASIATAFSGNATSNVEYVSAAEILQPAQPTCSNDAPSNSNGEHDEQRTNSCHSDEEHEGGHTQRALNAFKALLSRV